MKTNFTEKEIHQNILILKQFFDIVRLVDINTCTVKDVFINNNINDAHIGHCYDFWGNHSRCENCISARTVFEHSRNVKYEIKNGLVYNIISQYVCVDGKDLSLELLNEITETTLAQCNIMYKMLSDLNVYENQLTTDELTHTKNRRFIQQRFPDILASTLNNKDTELCMALIDIDKFKRINDNYGHILGDEILKFIGEYWTKFFKDNNNFIARYGGDEFLLISIEDSYNSFIKNIIDIYNNFEKTYTSQDGTIINFTLSIGCASINEIDTTNWIELFEVCDTRMYKSKRIGGNSISFK